MPTAWLKSLHCKSNAVDDVAFHSDHYSPLPPSNPTKPPKKPPLLPPLACGNSSQALKDIVLLLPKHQIRTAASRKPRRRPPNPKPTKPMPPHPRPSKPKPPSPSPAREPSSPFPTLSQLPSSHSSRRVVEIIFSSSWSGPGHTPFSGEIEMLFKVRNPGRTVARFEEYRDAIRSRAGPADSRCAADGNEMMRFHCAPAVPAVAPSGEAIYDAGVVCCSSRGGGIRTFSGSGEAHESGGPGVGRRRAMVVCRVIAGRVRTESEGDFESVLVGKGELLVFDPRAVLPCFLVLYKI